MTRFATFWVEGGKVVAPVNVLRFDDTIYRMLGDEPRGADDGDRAAARVEHVRRADARRAATLPGALLSEMKFTL